jgi:hypothetical protein
MAYIKTGRKPGPEPRPILDRLLEKTDVRGRDDCWLWQASCAAHYPQIHAGDKVRKAHVVLYELMIGPVPDGLELDHLCRTYRCVNPWHMEPVTRLENVRRSSATKLSMAQREVLRNSPERAEVLAERFGVHPRTIRTYRALA